MSKKRILLLSEGFGAGHTQAAYALSSHLRKLSPNIQTKVLELGSFLNPKVAPLIITAYKKTILNQPRLVGMMYRHQYKKSLNRLTTLALHRIFYTHTQNVVNQLRPDIIVCTHPIPSAVISRLKRLGVDTPLCTVITDYDAHGTWISPEVDRFLVSTPEVKYKLMQRGVHVSKIHVTGIPIHPNFWEHPGKEEIREKLHLKDLPTVLVMGGGWGMMSDEVINNFLTRWSDEIQIIFCVGSNDKILRKLEQDSRYNHPNIRLISFTREIDKLMEISDLLVTKPGGMTCTEGLAKGMPMLFHHPLPGQEEENCHYFTAMGLGEPISSLDVIIRWMNKLINEHADIKRMRQEHLDSIARYHPMQSAQVIVDMLETNKVPS
ncbi:UDP-N-acetylglucosamine--LPS N-acetylglucosamine transferase [Paenibacillus pini]|uniref:1,2-diacylglycerol 3-glucosyltransferase n=1 Tax=Paenibacillus pini JCM 16418 TaxID=1236976 RepID=W7YUM8_9BACL|nr:UDP-N-acetylglucosamine--LPS N-acetylglucosamine transferase [Paenibacillus pini]GAF06144.1 1,2-diacylglycerol 3-glucosyltransferase [Paenibacillus pini JCM 16418]